jgi:hypothetical protein
MKFLRLILLAGILTTLVFSACKKTEVKATTLQNYFAYNGVLYYLHQGMIKADGPTGIDSSTYKFGLWLVSNDYTISDLGTIVGTGKGIYMGLLSSNPDSILSGEYGYIFQSTDAFTFDYGATFIDYNITSDSGYKSRILDGYIKIKRTGSDTYDFNYNCTTEDGILMEGFYKGSVRSF